MSVHEISPILIVELEIAISKLKDDEIGYQHIVSLKQDGKDLTYKVNGTILEVTLAKPLLPKAKSIFEMKFNAQVSLASA